MAQNPDEGAPATTLIDQARQLVRDGRGDEAARTVRRYLSTSPGAAPDYELLGVALAMAGEGLQALAALEQAQSLNPQSASIAYNLGQAYRQAGRLPAAVAAYEQAVVLRPDYDTAKRALAAVRTQMAPTAPAGAPPAAADDATVDFPFPPADGPAAGKVRCLQCGMESRSGSACEWCSRSLVAPAAVSPEETGANAIAEVLLARSEWDHLAEGNLLQRTLKAMWMVISNPIGAVQGGLDTFYNSPGAPWAVIGFYVVALLSQVGIEVLARGGQAAAESQSLGEAILLSVGASLLLTLFTALFVAAYNAVTGGADNFLGDFGSLALSFALFVATVQLVTLPLNLGLAAMHVPERIFVRMGQNLWTFCLELTLLMVACEVNFIAALALLFGSTVFGYMGLSSLLSQLQGRGE